MTDELLEYLQHDSWRCGHPPHFYYASTPEHLAKGEDCPCGLIGALVRAGVDPEPWRPKAESP